MTIQVRGKLLKLVDNCPVEEAEVLHDKLLEKPDVQVDLSECTHLHSAVVQVLLAQPRPVKRVADEPFIVRWVVPAIHRQLEQSSNGRD